MAEDTNAPILRVEVTTQQCEAGTAYQHHVSCDIVNNTWDGLSITDVIKSVQTLYGDEGVTAICIYVEEEDKEE